MDIGAWQSTVRRVTKSQKQFYTQTHTHNMYLFYSVLKYRYLEMDNISNIFSPLSDSLYTIDICLSVV